MVRVLALVLLSMPLLTCDLSYAEEELVPIAESGGWIAMEHRENMTDPPDVCVAINMETGVAFRSQGNSVQLRIMNKKWSLPIGVKGALLLTVSDWKKSYDIDDNTESMVNADIPDDDVTDLFSRMDHAAIMQIVPGKAKLIDVSLSGSTRVTNAFRTCAGIRGNVSSPGSNPFE